MPHANFIISIRKLSQKCLLTFTYICSNLYDYCFIGFKMFLEHNLNNKFIQEAILKI